MQPKPDVAKLWPGAPRNVTQVTYTGGYSYNLGTGKVDELFNFSKLIRNDEYWRAQVTNGSIYPRSSGDYTSVSVTSGKADIRVIKKDGSKGSDLLSRR